MREFSFKLLRRNITMKYFTVLLALCAFASPLAAFEFNQSNSELKFTGSYDGEPVNGVFKKFSGKVNFTSKDLSAPQFDVSIDVASLDSEYAERDEMLKSAEWFDTARFPTATFKTEACKLTNKTCLGSLRIRDKTTPTTVSIVIAADGKSVTGSATIKRQDFGIGSGEWEDAGVIGQDVAIAFTVRSLAD
jgi:polyisoprenoid-binding protein YceI